MYNRLLAKRLLMRTSKDFEIETQFVARLKSECGEQFTERVEILFKDVTESRKICDELAESNKNLMKSNLTSSGKRSSAQPDIKKEKPIDNLDVTLIENKTWPVDFDQEVNITLPTALASSFVDFTAFYSK